MTPMLVRVALVNTVICIDNAPLKSIGISLQELLLISIPIGGGMVLVTLILLVMAVWMVRRKTNSSGSSRLETSG